MGSFQQSTSSLEGSSTGYETPDEINELRQISLEYVRQVECIHAPLTSQLHTM